MPDSASARQRNWPMRTVIALAVLASFAASIGGHFVDWDDHDLITSDPNFNPPTFHGLIDHWRRPDHQMYIPVIYSAWWVLAHLGMNPHVFHAANVIAHVLSALIVFQILSTLIESRWAACAGAVLFAVHPLQTEAVAWATGMKDCLSGLIALTAIWQYLRARQLDSQRRFLIASAIFILALLAKPSTVCVPLICLTLDRLTLQTPWRRIVQWIAPWLALAGGCAVVASLVQPIPDWLHAPPPAKRLLVAGDCLWWYCRKLIWPTHLAVDYSRTPAAVLASPHPWIGAAAVELIALAILLTRRRALWSAALVFVIGLLPVLGLTPFVFQQYSTVADRYAYLALLGPAVALAWLLSRTRSAWWFAPAGAILATLIALSFRQTLVWHDTLSLFSHTLAVNPTSLAANRTLGYYWAQQGDDAKALRFYEHTEDLYPNDPANEFNFANLLRRQGYIAPALRRYEKAIALRPDKAKFSLNYGLALVEANRPADALAAFTNAADDDPNNPDAYQNAGLLLEQMGAIEQAKQAFRETLKLDPARAVARRHLESLTTRP